MSRQKAIQTWEELQVLLDECYPALEKLQSFMGSEEFEDMKKYLADDDGFYYYDNFKSWLYELPDLMY